MFIQVHGIRVVRRYYWTLPLCRYRYGNNHIKPYDGSKSNPMNFIYTFLQTQFERVIRVYIACK